MNCPDCGHRNPDDAKACAACAAPLAAASGQSPDADTVLPPGPSQEQTRTAGGAPTQGLSGAPTLDSGSGASRQAPTGLRPGQRLGDRYEIVALLGEGGFGAVYKAHDRELDRMVAVKVMREEVASSRQNLERFKREILLASKITHKNVIRIHDLGTVGDLKFVSMSFIEGADLGVLIQREAPMDQERALALFHQIAEGLQAAHEAGVVHRDLKPQNVLVDEEDNAYVADFGLSRSVDPGRTMTKTGTLLGTVAYMSPEQARGETADHRSDIFSLGLILYEMLSGVLPFRSPSPVSQLMKRVQEDAPSITTSRAGLPPWLVRIVSRSVARDVTDRYQTVADLVRDIDRQHAAVTFRRALRKRILMSVAFLALAVLLVVGVGWLRRQAQPAGPPPLQAELILTPFRNVTADPRDNWAEHGLADLLGSQLRQSRALRVVGEGRVLDVVDNLKLGGGGQFDEVAVQRLSRVLGAENVITADLFRSGEQLRIEAELLRIGPASVASRVSMQTEAAGENALFTMIDDLAEQIREQLGISTLRVEQRRRTTQLSTASVAALRLYTEAAAKVREGSDVEGAERLEEAIQEDPAFAMARAMLAETYERLGRTEEALAQAETATDGLRDVSAYEYARIRAVRAGLLGDDEAAEAAYRELTVLAPNRPEAFLALALFQEDSGDLEVALESMRRAVDLDPSSAGARFAHGRVLAKLGRADDALGEFEEALELHKNSGNDEGRANVLNGFGNVYSRRGDLEESLQAYQECLEVRREIGDRRGIGIALYNIGLTLSDMGSYQESIERIKESVDVLKELGNDTHLGEAWSALGDVHYWSGAVEAALEAYQQALETLRNTDDEAALARAFGNLGFINMVLGDYTEAFFHHKNALEKRRQRGDAFALVRSLADIGVLQHVQGYYEEALGYFHEGLELAKEQGSETVELAFAINLAEVHHDQGNYAASLAAQADAERLAREMAGTDQLVTSLTGLGHTRREIGDLDGAEEAFGEARELSAGLGVEALQAQVLIGQGLLLLAQGTRQPAMELLADAVSAAEASGEHRLLLLARLARGEAQRSEAELRSVLAEAGRTGLRPVAARTRLALAEARQDRGADAGETLAILDETVREAGEMHLRDVGLQAHNLAIGLLLSQAETEVAVEHVVAALKLLEEMRQGLHGDALDSFLARAATRSFAQPATLLLETSGSELQRTRLQSALTLEP